jgi:circadian clock protein KaiC
MPTKILYIPAAKDRAVMKKEEIVRIRTHIAELDKALSGGIPPGHTTLVTGGAGTFKSSYCFNIHYNAVQEGYKAVYVTLEQTSKSMLNQIESMGYDLEKVKLQRIEDTTSMFAGLVRMSKKNSDLIVIDIANIRRELLKLAKTRSSKHDWFSVIQDVLEKLKKEGLVDIFVLDSLTALYALSNFKEPRKDIFYVFSIIKELGCTSFLVSEIQQEKSSLSDYGIEDYLADGIIQLGVARREMRVLGELSVIKMRSTPINRDVFVIEYKDRAFRVNPYWMRPSVLP